MHEDYNVTLLVCSYFGKLAFTRKRQTQRKIYVRKKVYQSVTLPTEGFVWMQTVYAQPWPLRVSDTWRHL